MTLKLRKLSVLIIAAVLLVAMAFAGAASANYVEVSNWTELKTAVESWTNPNEMCTIVLNNNSIVCEEPGVPFEGIRIKGNITIMPNATGGEFKIDALGKGRLFLFGDSENGNLTLRGNLTNPGSVLNLTGGNTNNGGGCVMIDKTGNLTIERGVNITNCSSTQGGAIYISAFLSSKVTIDGGNITDCHATNGNGGGVYVDSESNNIMLIMNEGTISGCTVSGGGGVYLGGSGAFIMNGGTITECHASSGGGIFVSSGYTFVMNDGTISDCSASDGGGVYLVNSGTFIMTGGKITGCVKGDGVWVNAVIGNVPTFIMNNTALVDADNAVYLMCCADSSNDGEGTFTNITLGSGGFKQGNYGAKNITLQSPKNWLSDIPVVKNGKENASYFNLSQALHDYSGYILKTKDDNLVLGIDDTFFIAVTNATVTRLLQNEGEVIYGDNGAGTATLRANGTGSDGMWILELNGFKASNTSNVPIISTRVPNLKIVLNGDSTLTGSYISDERMGLIHAFGNLTINATSTGGKLQVQNTLSSDDGKAYSIYADKDLTITDKANVTAKIYGSYTEDHNINTIALYAEGNISIVNSGIIDANATTVSSPETSGGAFAIEANKSILIEKADLVNATAISYRRNAEAINCANKFDIISSTVTINVVSNITDSEAAQNPAMGISTNKGENLTIENSKVTINATQRGTMGMLLGINNGEIDTPPKGKDIIINSSTIEINLQKSSPNVLAVGIDTLKGKIIISGESTEIKINEGEPESITCGMLGGTGLTINGCNQIRSNGVVSSFASYISTMGGYHDVSALSEYSFSNQTTIGAEPTSYDAFNNNWHDYDLNIMITILNLSISNYTSVKIEKVNTSTPYGITITNKTGSYPLTSNLTKVYDDDAKGYANLSVINTTTGTYTLELNGFKATNAGHTDQPIINASVANLTIKLVGESNLTGSCLDKKKGLLYSSGNLTIEGTDDSSKLLVNNTNSSSNPMFSISVKQKLTIDNAKVTAIANNGVGSAYALCSNNKLRITGSNAVFEANATSANIGAYSILSTDIEIDSSANVNAKAQGNDSTYALCSYGNVSIGSGAVVEANANSTNSVAYSIYADDGNITIEDGATVTATANTSDQGDAFTIVSGSCLVINESVVTAKAKGGHDFVEALVATTIVVSGENTIIDATAIDTNNSVAYPFFGKASISITSAKKITAIGSSAYGNASSFAYDVKGSRDFSGLTSGYTFSNATNPGSAPTSYAVFNNSNNWHIGYDDESWDDMVSNFSAVTIQKSTAPTPTPSYSGSTKQTGYTQILSAGQVAPTPYATTTPTAAPTAAPTQVTPTAKPTTQATTQPTQSSPAPIAGLIAGLGAAALVLARMRK